jgi:integrase
MPNVQLTNSNPNPKSGSLLDTLPAWLDSPEKPFPDWLKNQGRADSTIRVKSSMWGKFLRYLGSIGVPMHECLPSHVADFITLGHLDKEQGWRYIKLIERTYAHLNALGLNLANPGQLAGKNTPTIGHNAPMRFLDKEEKHRLENYVLMKLSQAEDAFPWYREEKKKKKKEATVLFACTRDAAVSALAYGAGMKVSEIIRLSVNCTLDNEVLDLPRLKFEMDRKIPLFPVAAEALRVWGLYRNLELDMGAVMFPSDTTRRRDDQRKQTAHMHPATVFRRVSALLHAAGIEDARACGQTLRNTYAAELIEAGVEDDVLCEAIGYQEVTSALHLRAEYERFLIRAGSD